MPRKIWSGIDDTPNAFTFTDQSGVNPSTSTPSANVTITGIQGAVPVSITSGTGDFSINGGGYTTSGVILNGQTLSARVTSSASYSTAVNLTVKVGNVSDTFTVTTRAADTTPAAFSFTNQSSLEISTLTTSNSITLTGMDAGVSISLSKSANIHSYDAATTTLPGTYASPTSVTSSGTGTIVLRARMTSSGSYSTGISGTVTAGGTTSSSWTLTTRAADTTPGAFAFTDQTGVERSVTCTSNTVTVSGFDPSVSVTVDASGGTVDAGTSALSGTFAASKNVTTSGTGTIVIAARVTSSASFSTGVSCTVTISGVSDIFTATTRAVDVTGAFWDATRFGSQTGVAVSTSYDSGQIGITGFEANYPLTCTASGGSVAVATPSGSYTAFGSSAQATTDGAGGLWVKARVTSSASNSTQTTCTVTMGNLSDTWSVTTVAGNVPQANYNGAQVIGEDATSPYSMTADVTFNTNGTVSGTGFPINGSFGFPTTYSSNGSTGTTGWFVKAVLNSGQTPTGTFGSYLQLNSARSWSYGASSANRICSITFYVNTSASDTGAVTGTVTLETLNGI